MHTTFLPDFIPPNRKAIKDFSIPNYFLGSFPKSEKRRSLGETFRSSGRSSRLRTTCAATWTGSPTPRISSPVRTASRLGEQVTTQSTRDINCRSLGRTAPFTAPGVTVDSRSLVHIVRIGDLQLDELEVEPEGENIMLWQGAVVAG